MTLHLTARKTAMTMTNQNDPALPKTAQAGITIGACILAAAFLASDFPAWSWLYKSWTTMADNSHGLLVPVFSAWLLWSRRHVILNSNSTVTWPPVLSGIALILTGIGMRWSGIYTRGMTLQSASIIPCVAGIVLCCGGWTGMRWAWPSVLFLGFMIPLPTSVGGLLGNALQKLATIASTFFLQMVGIPAVSEGNIILLTEKTIGVAEACSGLRMLTTFFALATGMSFVVNRPVWEKVVIVLSAPLIAVLANLLRISATAIAFEYGNDEMANLIFHDLAGWLMMPIGLALLSLELFLSSKVFEKVDQDDFRFESLTTSLGN